MLRVFKEECAVCFRCAESCPGLFIPLKASPRMTQVRTRGGHLKKGHKRCLEWSLMDEFALEKGFFFFDGFEGGQFGQFLDKAAPD